jgi:hypothetical protein
MSPHAHLVAHLVGSVPLDDRESVMRTLAQALGPHVRRLPDGETGRRADWIGFVRRHLGRHPAFEKDTATPPFQFKQWDGTVVMEWPLLKFRGGIDRSAVVFNTGYARDAIESFKVFARLQVDGVIAEQVRFQACAATPLAIAYMYVTPADRADFTRAYTCHLADEIAAMAAALPLDRLAVQWDVCQEVLMWEGYFDQPPHYKDEILASLGTIGDAVPEPVELGYHLCYGSPLDEHCLQPKDMAVLVEMTNGIVAAVRRGVQFFHLPVPQARNDAAYFAPLSGLKLPPGTELYLGCVHAGDPAGSKAKLARARQHVGIAGVGTECGWGRGRPEKLAAILAAHAELIEGD